MGTWSVDGESKPGILQLRVVGTVAIDEMKQFVAAHNAAIDAFGEKDYRVFLDIREMAPLSKAAAELFTEAKAHSNAKPNFRGSAVWVQSAIVEMQHKRTSDISGVLSTELISHDVDALWLHLSKVHRDKK